MADKQVRLYPLTPADLAQAVRNAGFEGYKANDFTHNLECEGVWVNEDGRFSACYSYTYFDDNEDRNMVGRLYVTVSKNVAGEPQLYADW